MANVARVVSYGQREFFNEGGCACPALDDQTYEGIVEDSPWYDADHPESEDFIGFLPQSITLSPPANRGTTPVATVGSFIGSERLSGRVIEIIGWMVARNLPAMWYGERWLTEALRGSLCSDCGLDELKVLPFCREAEYEIDPADDFRTLVGAALVDGPRFTELSDEPDWVVLTTQFQLVASMPYLYHSQTRCLDAEPLVGTLDCSLTTPGWTEDGTFVIDLTNTGTTVATDIAIQGQISLDGSCPVSGLGTSVPPSWSYLISELGPEDRIIIDGTRRTARRYDASCKNWVSALPSFDFEGVWSWPEQGPCSTMCVTISGGSADVEVTVDSYLRER